MDKEINEFGGGIHLLAAGLELFVYVKHFFLHFFVIDQFN